MKLTHRGNLGYGFLCAFGLLISFGCFLGLTSTAAVVGVLGGIVIAVLSGIGASCNDAAHYLRYLALLKSQEYAVEEVRRAAAAPQAEPVRGPPSYKV